MLRGRHGSLPEQAFSSDQLYQVLESCVSDSAPPDSEVKVDNAVLDRHALGRIRALHRPGGPNLLAKVLGLYSSSSLALTDAIRTAAQSNDAESIRQAAHALKSSSANVGAMAFRSCARTWSRRSAGQTRPRPGTGRGLLAEHKKVLQALTAKYCR